MAIRTNRMRELWDGVPEADQLQAMLLQARDVRRPLRERQYAMSYLNGTVKVFAGLEKRRALAEYLQRQLRDIKAKLYYSDTGSS